MDLKDRLKLVPSSPGCYVYRDEKGSVLYIGKAVNLKNRVRSYFQKGANHYGRIARMVRLVRDVEWFVTDSEIEALILESTLIKRFKPPFNIRLRDDKSYPYICVTVNDPYPRVFFTRKPRLKPDGNRYFGPYTNTRSVRDTLRAVRRIFGIQSCKPRFTGEEKLKPCLYFHLNQCLGPCTGTLPREEYMRAVRQVCRFLEGKQDDILKEMEKQMQASSENLQFERAAAIRDRILSIQRLLERQKVFSVEQEDQDVIGLARDNISAVMHVFFIRSGRLVGQENFPMESDPSDSDNDIVSQFLKLYYQGAAAIPREILVPAAVEDCDVLESWLSQKRGKKVTIHYPLKGEKKKLVEMVSRNARIMMEKQAQVAVSTTAGRELACMELAEALDMDSPPVRIECYDISNFQGEFSVGSMVVFEDGAPAKSQYRRFRVKSVSGPDDFSSIKEIISRRLENAAQEDEKFINLPDLMLIDGGKGQLSAAMEAVRESGQEGFVVASIAKKDEEIFLPGRLQSVRLPRHSAALRLVQRLRDEAHRFALAYHRNLRGKGSLYSELDGVPGIGDVRRRSLLRHFGSLDEIRKASLEQLQAVPGMNRLSAEALYSFLHSDDNQVLSDESAYGA